MTTKNSLFRRPQVVETDTPGTFEQYGLRQNPFPNLPGVVPGNDDPRVNGSIYQRDLRRAEQEKFDRLLIPAPAHPDARGMAFLMDCATRFGRGVGKTAFLNHQRQRIMSDLGGETSGGSHVLFASHILPPSDGRCRKFWQFCRLVIDSFVEQGIIAQAMWRLRAFSEKVPDELLTQVGDNPQATIGNDTWLVKQGVNLEFGLIPALTRTLEAAGVTESLANDLATKGHSPELFRSAFFCGQSDHVWRQHAGHWLCDELVRLFRKADFTRGLLLIDDFERIVVHQNAHERLSFVEELRYYLVEGPFENTRCHFYSTLWTIHPYVQELLVSHWHQVGLDRFCALGGELASEHTIDFPPLEEQAASPLALEYLDRSRLRNEDRGTLQPFDREGILEALRLVKGMPGRFLALLFAVIEHAGREKWPAIGAEQVRAVYREFSPTPLDGEDRKELSPAKVNLQE